MRENLRISSSVTDDCYIPSGLNAFQATMYRHLIAWKRKHVPGVEADAAGRYDAKLEEYAIQESPHLYRPIREVFADHQIRFPFRIHKHFFHMASSQAACANLFLPILEHPRAAEILSSIKPDIARIERHVLDNGYRVEFWDEPDDHLGDKTGRTGTDADIAIAYHNHKDELCLWLIEHKLTEAEFTTCGAYRSMVRQQTDETLAEQYDPSHCDNSFADIARKPGLCYYHTKNKFRYWTLTQEDRDLFVQSSGVQTCPFKGGMNQLWRNVLLAKAIEQKGELYKKVFFSVVRHPGNGSLTGTIEEFSRLIGNNPLFTSLTSDQFVNAARDMSTDGDPLRQWVDWYCDLYDLAAYKQNAKGPAPA